MKFVLKSIKKDLGGTKLLKHFLDLDKKYLIKQGREIFLAPSKYGS